jgi:hypothetical protein
MLVPYLHGEFNRLLEGWLNRPLPLALNVDLLAGFVGAWQRQHKTIGAGQVKESPGGASPAVDTNAVTGGIMAEILWPPSGGTEAMFVGHKLFAFQEFTRDASDVPGPLMGAERAQEMQDDPAGRFGRQRKKCRMHNAQCRIKKKFHGFDSLCSTVLVLPQSADKTRQILPALGF